MKIDGGCHCGFIQYEAEIDPDDVLICHCTDCQTLSGSAFRTVVFASEDDFMLRTGQPKVYVKTTAASGSPREQTFCPECGSPIYSAPVGGTSRRLGLRLGTVRQRDQLPPKFQYFSHSAQAWLDGLTALPKK
jgi:hypothetical protein